MVRLPLLRASVADWLRARGREAPAPGSEVEPSVLLEADPEVPVWVAALRSGDVARRAIAAAAVNDRLIAWAAAAGAAGESTLAARVSAMEAVLDDLTWLLRHGTPYGAGVAAAALAQYPREAQRQYLSAVAALPAVALLSSPDAYARHSAARLLNQLARAHTGMPEVLLAAGAVPGLLRQVDVSQPFPYIRSPAAATLWGMAAEGTPEVLAAVRGFGGVALLAGMALQQEPEGAPGAAGGRGWLVADSCCRRWLLCTRHWGSYRGTRVGWPC